MNHLEKLKKRREDVLKEIKRIGDEAAKRDNGGFEDAELTQVRALKDEFNTIEASIGIVDEIAERSKPGKSSAATDPADQTRAGGEETQTRAGEGKCPEFFRNMGEQLRAVRDAATGRGNDPRLAKLSDWQRQERAALGLSEAVDSDGGYLIQPTFISTLMQRAYTASNLAARCSKIGLTAGNRIKIPGMVDDNFTDGNRWGGVQAYWSNEADTATAQKPKFRYIDMSLEKLLAFCYATEEELEDIPALAGVIQQQFGREFGYKLDQAILFGDGVGKPQGLMKSPALITQAKESGQTAATVVFNNVIKMRAHLLAASRANAAWFINQDVEVQLILMSFAPASATLIPVWLPGNSAVGQVQDRLLNIPVVPIMQAKTVGTLGDIILADLTEYLLIDKGGMQADSSMHVQFLTAQNVFRFQYRVNGQTPWEKAVTPENGTNTISPFVALAAR